MRRDQNNSLGFAVNIRKLADSRVGMFRQRSDNVQITKFTELQVSSSHGMLSIYIGANRTNFRFRVALNELRTRADCLQLAVVRERSTTHDVRSVGKMVLNLAAGAPSVNGSTTPAPGTICCMIHALIILC